MGRRLFPDNDAWTDEAAKAGNNITVALMDLLDILESDGPVDLRDFHYLVTQATSNFVSQMAIHRRFYGEEAGPKEVWRAYPQLDKEPKHWRLSPGRRKVKLLPEFCQR